MKARRVGSVIPMTRASTRDDGNKYATVQRHKLLRTQAGTFIASPQWEKSDENRMHYRFPLP
jgi:hypothetical protein